jgi:hypothetical protein
MAVSAVPRNSGRLKRPRAALVLTFAGLLVVGLTAWLAFDLLMGVRRLPDTAEVLSTTWGATQWVRKGGKADVTLRLRRHDGGAICSRFVVVAYGGQVTHKGPSEGAFIFAPSMHEVPPAAGPGAQELLIDLEMIPSRPGECSGEVVVYNDAPVWQVYWSRKLPSFLRPHDTGLALRSWEVRLPPAPGTATVRQME